MEGIDWASRSVLCTGGVEVPFDYCCLNLGSITQHSNLPGVQEHAIATRPISDLLGKITARDQKIKEMKEIGDTHRRVVVVGSGAAGLELAWAFR